MSDREIMDAKNGIEIRESYGFRDPVVKNVVDKFVSRSDVGYEKYGNSWYDVEYTGEYIVFYNSNPATGLPYDTITICINYNNNKNISNDCCNSFYSIPNGAWDLNWIKIENITFIKEVTNKITNNKIYDLYGREIVKPKGLYIKNNKLYYVR